MAKVYEKTGQELADLFYEFVSLSVDKSTKVREASEPNYEGSIVSAFVEITEISNKIEEIKGKINSLGVPV